MKVLFLNHNYVGYGTYWRAFYLGKYLAKLGHEVTMVCASEKNLDFKVRKTKIDEKFYRVTLPRIKYSRYYTGQELRMFISTLQSLVYKYDIIHCFTVAQPQVGIPGLFAKVFRKKKFVVDFDDLWSNGFTKYHSTLIRKILNLCELKIPRFADKVTVVSDFLKKKVSAYLGSEEKIVKLPNGSNVDEIKPLDKYESRKALGLNINDPIIVSLGHTYMKSFDFLINAFKKVTDEVPNAKLLIVGKIDLPLKSISPCKNVIFVDEQPFKKIPQYLSVADVLVLPMEDSSIAVSYTHLTLPTN